MKTKFLVTSFDAIEPKNYIRVKTLDSPEMKQFLKQRGKLLLRNGILYHKNDT